MFQTIQLIGRAGGNGKQGTASNGTQYAMLDLAVTIGYGENRSTCWVSCSFWGDLAKAAVERIQTGNIVMVRGSDFELTSYTDKQGKVQPKLRLRVDKFAAYDTVRREPQSEQQGLDF